MRIIVSRLFATLGILSGTIGLHASVHTWTGAGSGLWSDPLNWIGGAPQPGESPPVTLDFPASAPAHRDLTNDIRGLTVQALTITAHANTFHATSNVMLGLQNATVAGLGNSTIFANSFRLQLGGHNELAGSNNFIIRGTITESAPGASLDVSGNVSLETASRHSGPTQLSAGLINIYGAVTNMAFLHTATNATLALAADFTVLTNLGRLHIVPECLERPETSRLFGLGLVCAPTATTSVMMIDYPANDSTDPADGNRLHSHLVVDGPVVLAGRLEAGTDLFQGGLRFTIIQNVGAVPTQGQFDGLPEGALMRMQFSALLARISYRGGDGNDVTLTLVEPPVGRRLAGPWLLANGWVQILGNTAEFEGLLPHRWEVSEDIADPQGWLPLGPTFIPGEEAILLTLTNAATIPQRFFRLAIP